MLSDSESENGSSNEHQLIINEHYAKAFQYRKEREELVRCTSSPENNPKLTSM
jgi:protein KRI1